MLYCFLHCVMHDLQMLVCITYRCQNLRTTEQPRCYYALGQYMQEKNWSTRNTLQNFRKISENCLVSYWVHFSNDILNWYGEFCYVEKNKALIGTP